MKPLTVLITGAAGNIGGKLRAHLAARGSYALRLTDLNPGNDPDIIGADLSRYDEDWATLFAGVDVVVHLAANSRPNAGWDKVMGPNVDAVLNVFRVAMRHSVRRIVFASSVWAMEGRFRDDEPIAAGEPAPGKSAYGISKALGERVAKAFAQAPGLSSIVLRIGYCKTGDNPPGSSRFLWENDAWLSNRDLCQGLERAIKSDRGGFSVVNLTSANRNSRWTLTEAQEILGYEPEDGYVPPSQPVHVALAHRAPGATKIRKSLFARILELRRSL